jgi:tRNA A37 threonylcarbamoyltransferase TsaD
MASYGPTTTLLRDVLPLDEGVQPEIVRRQVQRVAARAEQALREEQTSFSEGGQLAWDQLPIPAGPLMVGLDGATSAHGITRAGSR